MADNNQPQIGFYFRNTSENNSLSMKNGQVVISPINPEDPSNLVAANMHVQWEGKTYQVKPSYNWNEILGLIDGSALEEYINNKIQSVAFQYLNIQKQDNTLNISVGNSEGNVPSGGESGGDSGGDSVNLDAIQSGNENGTFLVGNRPVFITGLESAAYTESESYIPSNWTDLTISEGGDNNGNI